MKSSTIIAILAYTSVVVGAAIPEPVVKADAAYRYASVSQRSSNGNTNTGDSEREHGENVTQLSRQMPLIEKELGGNVMQL